MSQRTRVVIVEPASDDGAGHARSIARAMRDAGVEVVYLGALREPTQIASAAVQEDAHAVGVAADLLEAVRAELAPDHLDHLDEILVFELVAATAAGVDAVVDQVRAAADEA